MKRRELPAGARIVAFLAATAGLTLLSGWWLAAVAACLTVAAALCEPAARCLLGRPRFWLLLGSPLLITLLAFGRWGEPRLGLSAEELRLAGEMSLRALALLMAAQLALSGLTVSRLMRWFDRRGLRGLGFALGVAHNMLDTLGDTLAGAFVSIRLRGGFRRRPFRALGLLLVTVLARTVTHAEEVVNAACARAFDPSAAGPETRRKVRRKRLQLRAGPGTGF